EPFVDSDGRISLVDSEPEPSKTALAGKLLNELHTAPPGSRTATRLVQIKLTDEQLAGRRLRFDGQIANEGTTPAHDEILVPAIELLADRPSTLEPPKHVVNLGSTDQGNVILVPNVARERSHCLDVVMQRQRPDIDWFHHRCECRVWRVGYSQRERLALHTLHQTSQGRRRSARLTRGRGGARSTPCPAYRSPTAGLHAHRASRRCRQGGGTPCIRSGVANRRNRL